MTQDEGAECQEAKQKIVDVAFHEVDRMNDECKVGAIEKSAREYVRIMTQTVEATGWEIDND